MSEHIRTEDHLKNIYQWVDTEGYIIIDKVTGEMECFGKYLNSIGNYKEAIEYIRKRHSEVNPRFIIIKLSCIESFKI